MKTLYLCLLIAFTPLSSLADDQSQWASLDRLRVGAVSAYNANDKEKALALTLEGLKLDPTHSAFLFNSLFLALELKDEDTILQSLNSYQQLGLLPPEPLLTKAYKAIGEEQSLAFKGYFRLIARPRGQATPFLTLPDSLKLVEGLATHKDGSLYVSTVAGGALYKAKKGQEPQLLIKGKDHGIQQFFGIALSADEKTLYATFADIRSEGTGGSGLLAYDLETKTTEIITRFASAPSESKRQLADLTVTASGAVYCTDAVAGTLYQLSVDKVLTPLLPYGSLKSPQGLVAQNDALIIADYGRGLIHFDLKTNIMTPIHSDHATSYLGIDGLTAANGLLYAVQNGLLPHRVIAITLDKTGKKVTGHQVLLANHKDFQEPTLITSSPAGLLLVAASQWPSYDRQLALKKDKKQQKTPILLLPLTTR